MGKKHKKHHKHDEEKGDKSLKLVLKVPAASGGVSHHTSSSGGHVGASEKESKSGSSAIGKSGSKGPGGDRGGDVLKKKKKKKKHSVSDVNPGASEHGSYDVQRVEGDGSKHHRHHHHHHKHAKKSKKRKHEDHGDSVNSSSSTPVVKATTGGPPSKKICVVSVGIRAAQVTSTVKSAAGSIFPIESSVEASKPPASAQPVAAMSMVAPQEAARSTPSMTAAAEVAPPEPVLNPAKLKNLLLHIHKILKKKDVHEFFAMPVSDLFAPGYSKIITRPMDMQTMQQKIEQSEYKSLGEYRSDFQQMCENAMIYNAPDTVYFKSATRLLKAGLKVINRDRSSTMAVPAAGSCLNMPQSAMPVDDAPTPSPEQSRAQGPADQLVVVVDDQQVLAKKEKKRTTSAAVILQRKIAAEAVQKAKLAAKRAASLCGGRKFGYLEEDENGRVVMHVLNPDSVIAEPGEPRLVDLLGPAKATESREDKEKKTTRTPVAALKNGAYSSYAPSYDSTFANLTPAEAELLYTSYGDHPGFHYAQSLRSFVKDIGSSYMSNMLDLFLNQLTMGGHHKAMPLIRELEESLAPAKKKTDKDASGSEADSKDDSKEKENAESKGESKGTNKAVADEKGGEKETKAVDNDKNEEAPMDVDKQTDKDPAAGQSKADEDVTMDDLLTLANEGIDVSFLEELRGTKAFVGKALSTDSTSVKATAPHMTSSSSAGDSSSSSRVGTAAPNLPEMCAPTAANQPVARTQDRSEIVSNVDTSSMSPQQAVMPMSAGASTSALSSLAITETSSGQSRSSSPSGSSSSSDNSSDSDDSTSSTSSTDGKEEATSGNMSVPINTSSVSTAGANSTADVLTSFVDTRQLHASPSLHQTGIEAMDVQPAQPVSGHMPMSLFQPQIPQLPNKEAQARLDSNADVLSKLLHQQTQRLSTALPTVASLLPNEQERRLAGQLSSGLCQLTAQVPPLAVSSMGNMHLGHHGNTLREEKAAEEKKPPMFSTDSLLEY